MSIKIIPGNILNSEETCIAHQCNCITIKSMGIAKQIFDRYPKSNTYLTRESPSIAGSIDIIPCQSPKICESSGNYELMKTTVTVINMYAQIYPGKSKYPGDNSSDRVRFFKMSLDNIETYADFDTIAVPYNIGCGLAGGNWEIYLQMLTNFAKESGINVHVYQK